MLNEQRQKFKCKMYFQFLLKILTGRNLDWKAQKTQKNIDLFKYKFEYKEWTFLKRSFCLGLCSV